MVVNSRETGVYLGLCGRCWTVPEGYMAPRAGIEPATYRLGGGLCATCDQWHTIKMALFQQYGVNQC